MLTVPEEIKDLLHQDTCRKNIRIQFPNGERTDICNNLIVKDSVSFTESLCSQDTLKFGLCESPVFECETVGVGNIKGATIEVFCEIFCDMNVSGAVFRPDLGAYVYPIPYGSFIVESSKRQADMIHRKIIAYGFLYNSLLYEVNANTSLSVFELSKILDSSGSNDIGLETLIYETYPYLLNENDYTVTKTYIEDNISFSALAAQTWYFYVGATSYALYWYTAGRNMNKGSNQLIVADFANMPYKSSSEVNDYSEQIISLLESAYPNPTDGLGNPFSFRNAINSLNLEQTVPTVRYTRSDYVSQGTVHNKVFDMQKGRWVYFNRYSTQGFSMRNAGFKFAVRNISAGTTSDVGSAFHYFGADAYFSTVPISEVGITSYTITTAKDSYTAYYGSSTVTCTGYSYREAVEKLDMLDLMKAYAEMKGFFWNVLRDNPRQLYIKEQFNLNPGSALYPESDLYPEGVVGGKLLPSDYRSCWYDDEYTKPFGAVVCNYKNGNNEDCAFYLYLTGFDTDSDVNTYQTYDLSNNYIIKNSAWTESQIQTICETIAANIEGVTYMPVEFTGRGLPYVEAGDTFEILTKSNDSITTIVLNRTLSGEQTLTDSYKSV